MTKYTSFNLSKLLWDNGCRLESDEYICTTQQIEFKESPEFLNKYFNGYPKYDILWDICVKYAKEFFGDEFKARLFVFTIITKIQNNEGQEEIEKYIWDNCIFNPECKNYIKK